MARRGKRGGKNRNRKNAQVSGGGPLLDGGGPVNLSGWDAAEQSERRGYVVWPTLDTGRELSGHDRLEVMRKARAGVANVGFMRRCETGVSRLIGTLTPQAASGDEEYDKRAEEAFWRRAEHPQAFDMAEEMNFMMWQGATKRAKVVDGDGLSVLMEGSEGGGRILFYGAHQIGDGQRRWNEKMPKNLRDGVFLTKFGGRAGFRVLSGNGKVKGTIPRERGVYHYSLERPGRVRQVSGLAHAVSNVIDQIEILADTKHAVKLAALWGLWLETSMEGDGGAQVSKDLKAYLGEGDAGGPPVPAGGDAQAQMIQMEKVLRGGKFQGLNPGQSVKALQDTRPHPNTIALLSWMIRDVASGLKLHPEVLWDASKMSGPGMRYVMADTRRFIEDEQMDLARDCKRIWMYFLAKEIQAGRLERPKEGAKWWVSRWIPQADMTIDRGRDGKLDVERVEKNLKSRQAFWGEQGMDWKEAEEQVLREEIWREKKRAELQSELLGEA
jgi:capsid protein